MNSSGAELLGVSLPAASRPLLGCASPQKTCFSSALALVTYTACPARAQEVHEHRWLHRARISSLALLKLGINRRLIFIKRNIHCEGRVCPSPDGGGSHRQDAGGPWQMLRARHPSVLSHEWPPEANERDAGCLGRVVGSRERYWHWAPAAHWSTGRRLGSP